MLLVGLTGGIGSGKTSVSSRLAERGAVVVDADAIVRELQAPGQAVLAAMVERFGEAILLPDGSLDRQAVADMVFNDDAARADLGAIVHPAVRDEIARRVLDQADTDNVVILDIPLLAESGWDGIAGTIVVDLDPEIAVQRLVEFRGFAEADARARIATQASREERLAKASVVVDNSLDLEHLEAEVDKVWAWIESQRTTQREA
ncbi:MAG TPA: dephospho-CoA kinase [Microthrixaceae bacterium]|nr:dephospho-CoA kinase [Microthrixaceae bacterium]HMT25839.1 dephospho-CoA kinase [Microthrixaceae bacterium]HMT59680.1 dephospho-CoA kinase [Microthrixaceae bacterium]